MKQKIYVAGPCSNGDAETNVKNAFAAANQLADLGFSPFVPMPIIIGMNYFQDQTIFG